MYVTNAFGKDDHNQFYLNELTGNHWIIFDIDSGPSHSSVIGTKVSIKATINGKTVWQVRELTSQATAYSNNHHQLHFGLKDADSIETVKVRWPTGKISTLLMLEVDQKISLQQP